MSKRQSKSTIGPVELIDRVIKREREGRSVQPTPSRQLKTFCISPEIVINIEQNRAPSLLSRTTTGDAVSCDQTNALGAIGKPSMLR
jgi:hypothetical protein